MYAEKGTSQVRTTHHITIIPNRCFSPRTTRSSATTKQHKRKQQQPSQLGYNSIDYGESKTAKEAKEGALPSSGTTISTTTIQQQSAALGMGSS